MITVPIPDSPKDKNNEKSVDLAFTLGIIALCFVGIGVVVTSVLPDNPYDKSITDQILLVVFLAIALLQALPIAKKADKDFERKEEEKKLREDEPYISIVIKKEPINEEEKKG